MTIGPWWPEEVLPPDVAPLLPGDMTLTSPEPKPQHFTREGSDEYEAYTVALTPGSPAVVLCGDDSLRSTVAILMTNNVGSVTIGHRQTVSSGNGFNLAPNVMLNMSTCREVCANAPATNTGVALVSVITERNRA